MIYLCLNFKKYLEIAFDPNSNLWLNTILEFLENIFNFHLIKTAFTRTNYPRKKE